MKKNNFPIGIFDSGVGGTSIWKEISSLLPSENTVYLADSKNAPYGEKTQEEITALSIKNIDFLLKKKCKIIIVACNTATTSSIQFLREKYSIPIIGIEPAIKPAALKTKTKKIGILATKGTLNSTLFAETSSNINNEIIILEKIGTGLVELIEEGKLDSKELSKLLLAYLHPLMEENIDCLVLGCTHYPYLIPQIRKIVGHKIQIIDSGEAVARQTKAILELNAILNKSSDNGTHQFYINKNKSVLEMLILNSAKNIEVVQKDF